MWVSSRRRTIRTLIALLLVAGVLGGPLSGAAVAAAESQCVINDERLSEISGLAATSSGFAAINDGGEELSVFQLSNSCAVTDVRTWTGRNFNPADPEDLAVTSDGTTWIADTGDNELSRQTAAMWRIPASGDPVLYRLSYPNGPRDTEAIVMPANGTPVLVTKDPLGRAELYVPVRPLTGAAGTVDLRAAGSLTMTPSGTSGGLDEFGAANQLAITGGAISPDGKRVVLRTYTDAYEWDIPDGGDPAAVLSGSGKPRRTALPDEPQGEAITYSTDSRTFLTASEGSGQPLNKWKPAARSAARDAEKDEAASSDGAAGPWYRNITLDQVMTAVYAAGVLGLLLLAAGIIGVIRHRKRAREAAGGAGDDDGGIGGEQATDAADGDFVPPYDAATAYESAPPFGAEPPHHTVLNPPGAPGGAPPGAPHYPPSGFPPAGAAAPPSPGPSSGSSGTRQGTVYGGGAAGAAGGSGGTVYGRPPNS